MFVRTENGIYEVVEEVKSFIDLEVVGYKCKFNYCDEQRIEFIAKVDVIKASENLDDLFDCRVDVDSFHHITDFKNRDYNDEDKRCLFDSIRKNLLDCIAKNYVNIYGAIWTSKGLIYVAKMNEKGDFELI